MLNISSDNRLEASHLSYLHLKTWENALGLRISLQKVIGIVNKFPVLPSLISSEDINHLDGFTDIISNLYTMLETTISDQVASSKRKRLNVDDHPNVDWDDIAKQRESLRMNWKDIINKWHSRLQFGSKDAVSKMKTFKQSFWDQVSAVS